MNDKPAGTFEQDRLNFYLLRTPLISIERLIQLLRTDDWVAFMQENLVGEAIKIASPAFYTQLKADPILSNPKIRQTALKYLLRMGSRCTPFGLFAGCSLGKVGPATSIDLQNRRIHRSNWLDMQVLVELGRYLSHHPVLQEQLNFRPNTSLYRIGEQLRYTEVLPDKEETRHFLSQLNETILLRRVLKATAHGATVNQLVNELKRLDQPEGDARAFINALIQDQILISELSPNVTGTNFLTVLIDKVSRLSGGKEFADVLRYIESLLQQPYQPIADPRILRELIEQQIGIPLPFANIVQCDSFFQTEINQIGQTVLKQLQVTFAKLAPLSQPNTAIKDLNDFKARFYSQYEEREIPLAVALDGETGIGYGAMLDAGTSSLIEDLLVNPAKEVPVGLPAQIQKHLLQLYTAWQERDGPIDLTDQDIVQLSTGDPALPDSYYAWGYFLADSPQAIDTGQYQFVLKGLGGPSAFPLMGRFCRSDGLLTQQMRTYFDHLQQQDPNRIYAEVAHLPTPRTGNVAQRPHLRTYEIPYLVHSLLPLDQQISLDDLVVSVPRGERIVLRSRRLDKEVVPCLTIAHNHRSGLPLYHFLGDLQHQDRPILVNWQWGMLLTARRLPRVQYKQVILREAQWRLEAADLIPTLSDEQNVLAWQERWQLPRWIAVVQGDNELFLDLEIAACQKLLVASLHQQQTLILIEWMRTPDHCWINGPDGKLSHELVIPFRTKRGAALSHPHAFSPNTHLRQLATRRTYLPGSEWLYLKLYGGPQTITQLLLKLGKMAHKLMRSGLVTHWFFVRYEDPKSHLRLRFHLNDPNHSAKILTICHQIIEPLSRTDEVHRMQVDTYQRELERYGDGLTESAEWLFWADSETIYQLYRNQPADELLFSAAILGVDAYLTDFGYTLAKKTNMCERTFTVLFREQGEHTTQRAALAQKYRLNQASVLRLLKGETLSIDEGNLQRLFKQRSRRGKSYRAILQSAADLPADHLSSLIHLFINRLFSHHQRTYELLVYHHLSRAYQSLSAHRS